MALRSDCENLLFVGQRVLLNPTPNTRDAPRYHSIIRGWQKGEYVIFEVPMLDGVSLALKKGHICSTRYLQEGQICSFDTRVVDATGQQHQYVRLGWPEKIDVIVLRKKVRVDLRVLCSIFGDDGRKHEGTVVDISTGGCGIFTDVEYSKGSKVAVDLILPNGVRLKRLPCAVTNVRNLTKMVFLGCRFVSGDETTESDIEFFVANALELRRRDSIAADRVLLLDIDPHRMEEIVSHFADRDRDAIPVTSLVDAFYRIRVAPPAAFLVHRDNNGLEAIDIAKILRQTRGCEDLPFYVYGTRDSEYAEQWAGDPAAEYLAYADEPEKLADEVQKRLGT